MNDATVTWTVLSSSADDPFMDRWVTGMVDAHNRDHARQLFKAENPNRYILGIYEGDLSYVRAMDRYIEENQ